MSGSGRGDSGSSGPPSPPEVPADQAPDPTGDFFDKFFPRLNNPQNKEDLEGSLTEGSEQAAQVLSDKTGEPVSKEIVDELKSLRIQLADLIKKEISEKSNDSKTILESIRDETVKTNDLLKDKSEQVPDQPSKRPGDSPLTLSASQFQELLRQSKNDLRKITPETIGAATAPNVQGRSAVAPEPTGDDRLVISADQYQQMIRKAKEPKKINQKILDEVLKSEPVISPSQPSFNQPHVTPRSPEVPFVPPPVPQSHVRFYHGGDDYKGGSRWLTPDRKYAEGYALKTGIEGRKVSYVDLPRTSPHLQRTDSGSLISGIPDEKVDPSVYAHFDAPPEIASKLTPISSVSATGDLIPISVPSVPSMAPSTSSIVQGTTQQGINQAQPSPPIEPHPGIPFMITQNMRAQLMKLGYSQDEIRNLTPAAANEIIQSGIVHSPPSSNVGVQSAPIPTIQVSPTVTAASPAQGPQGSVLVNQPQVIPSSPPSVAPYVPSSTSAPVRKAPETHRTKDTHREIAPVSHAVDFAASRIGYAIHPALGIGLEGLGGASKIFRGATQVIKRTPAQDWWDRQHGVAPSRATTSLEPEVRQTLPDVGREEELKGVRPASRFGGISPIIGAGKGFISGLMGSSVSSPREGGDVETISEKAEHDVVAAEQEAKTYYKKSLDLLSKILEALGGLKKGGDEGKGLLDGLLKLLEGLGLNLRRPKNVKEEPGKTGEEGKTRESKVGEDADVVDKRSPAEKWWDDLHKNSTTAPVEPHPVVEASPRPTLKPDVSTPEPITPEVTAAQAPAESVPSTPTITPEVTATPETLTPEVTAAQAPAESVPSTPTITPEVTATPEPIIPEVTATPEPIIPEVTATPEPIIPEVTAAQAPAESVPSTPTITPEVTAAQAVSPPLTPEIVPSTPSSSPIAPTPEAPAISIPKPGLTSGIAGFGRNVLGSIKGSAILLGADLGITAAEDYTPEFPGKEILGTAGHEAVLGAAAGSTIGGVGAIPGAAVGFSLGTLKATTPNFPGKQTIFGGLEGGAAGAAVGGAAGGLIGGAGTLWSGGWGAVPGAAIGAVGGGLYGAYQGITGANASPTPSQSGGSEQSTKSVTIEGKKYLPDDPNYSKALSIAQRQQALMAPMQAGKDVSGEIESISKEADKLPNPVVKSPQEPVSAKPVTEQPKAPSISTPSDQSSVKPAEQSWWQRAKSAIGFGSTGPESRPPSDITVSDDTNAMMKGQEEGAKKKEEGWKIAGPVLPDSAHAEVDTKKVADTTQVPSSPATSMQDALESINKILTNIDSNIESMNKENQDQTKNFSDITSSITGQTKTLGDVNASITDQGKTLTVLDSSMSHIDSGITDQTKTLTSINTNIDSTNKQIIDQSKILTDVNSGIIEQGKTLTKNLTNIDANITKLISLLNLRQGATSSSPSKVNDPLGEVKEPQTDYFPAMQHSGQGYLAEPGQPTMPNQVPSIIKTQGNKYDNWFKNRRAGLPGDASSAPTETPEQQYQSASPPSDAVKADVDAMTQGRDQEATEDSQGWDVAGPVSIPGTMAPQVSASPPASAPADSVAATPPSDAVKADVDAMTQGHDLGTPASPAQSSVTQPPIADQPSSSPSAVLGTGTIASPASQLSEALRKKDTSAPVAQEPTTKEGVKEEPRSKDQASEATNEPLMKQSEAPKAEGAPAPSKWQSSISALKDFILHPSVAIPKLPFATRNETGQEIPVGSSSPNGPTAPSLPGGEPASPMSSLRSPTTPRSVAPGSVNASGPSAPVSKNLATNQQEAYSAARAEGLSESAAKILVSNMSGESLKNPTDSHYDVHHMSQGIVQWDPQRSAAIKAQFGKEPKDMTVAEQTKASIWEMKTNPAYSQSWQALNNEKLPAEQRLHTVVANYERPRDVSAAVDTRMKFYSGIGVKDQPQVGQNKTPDVNQPAGQVAQGQPTPSRPTSPDVVSSDVNAMTQGRVESKAAPSPGAVDSDVNAMVQGGKDAEVKTPQWNVAGPTMPQPNPVAQDAKSSEGYQTSIYPNDKEAPGPRSTDEEVKAAFPNQKVFVPQDKSQPVSESSSSGSLKIDIPPSVGALDNGPSSSTGSFDVSPPVPVNTPPTSSEQAATSAISTNAAAHQQVMAAAASTSQGNSGHEFPSSAPGGPTGGNAGSFFDIKNAFSPDETSLFALQRLG